MRTLIPKIILISFFLISACDAETLTKVDPALKEIFVQATDFEKTLICLSAEQLQSIGQAADIIFSLGHSNHVTRYVAKNNEQVIGYVFEDTVQGKWGPIHYLVGLDLEGAILKTIVLDYEEIRGKPVAKRRFLKQYTGKTIQNPLRLRKDIDGITGATISSRSLTDGVRKILFISKAISGPTSPSTCEGI